MEIVSIISILVSPAIAVLISIWLQNRKERRQNQLSVLGRLIAFRHEMVSPEAVRSLNMIDLIFYDKPTVRQLWHEYFGMLSNEGLNNPVGWQQRNKKNIELITEMAKVLGYGKAITHLDVDRVYSPVGIWEQITKNQEMQTELLRVLKATKTLNISAEKSVGEESKSLARY
jgi:hypothetical protein